MNLRIVIAFLVVCAVAVESVAQDSYERPESLAWSKRFGEAEIEYRNLLRTRPKDVRLRLGLARVILWSGRYGEAERAFQGLLKDQPENRDAWIGFAQAAYWSGDYRRAARRFREVIRRDPANADAAKSLQELSTVAAARYEVSAAVADDSQPFDALGARTRVSFFTDPLTRWDFMAGLGAVDGGAAPLRYAGVGILAGLPRLKMTAAASVEAFRFPNGENEPVGCFSLSRRTALRANATMGIERIPLLATVTSVGTSATATRMWISWQRDFTERYLGGFTAYRVDYSDDNRGAGADVYFLSPIGSRVRAGVSAAWRDTELSTFRFTGFESERLGAAFQYRYTGVYEVYWTPQDHRDVRAVATYEWRWLKLQADGGLGYERALSFGPSGGPTPVPAFTFPVVIDRTFQPWRASAEITVPLGSGLELRARVRHDVTSFYQANEFQASLVGRL